MTSLEADSLDPQALALLTYRLAELFGPDAAVVQALKRAARTADPDDAAAAWQHFLEIPQDMRGALARWLSLMLQAAPRRSVLFEETGVVVPFPDTARPLAPTRR